MDPQTDSTDLTTQAEQQTTPDPSAEKQNADNTGTVPFDRFQKVNEARKTAEAKLKELADAAEAKRIADEKAQRDALAEQGKHKDALIAAEGELTELRPLKDKVKAYETAIGEMLTSRMAGVPEHISKLLTGMDPLAALKWLDENAEQLGRKPAPKSDAGKSGDQKGDDTFSKAHINKVMEELGYPSR